MIPRRMVAPAGDAEIRHGYTLTDIHSLTKLAVNTAKGWLAMDYTDLMEAAWFGIVEHLHAAEHWPPRHDLIRAGQQAVNALVKDEMHHAGFFKYKTTTGYGPGSMPAFVKFWFAHHAQSPESGVVERAALAQVWAALTARQREAFAALAAHGDYVLAAAALDIELSTYMGLINRARKAFFALWHEGETPPTRIWRAGRSVMRRDTTDPVELERRARYAEQKRAQRREHAA
jgi:hypothetical protein